ncbi:TetR/AcrR family transcriptional regulator [Pilimelia columellifera]|uniref:TetR/AcrR family transcriptional regulator n=1 Tax=Pilimelia columellifera subsp. columellifera TaxID=706583 RepID=A0ABN3N3S1_9ACTN
MTASAPDRPAPTRRDRSRSATVQEILVAARRLLVSGGAAEISVRVIARDLGLTAAALYRYFPSLDAIVTALAINLYDELRAQLEQARDAGPGHDPAGQVTRMAWRFRNWALAHPAEFGLLFGNPVPGVQAIERDCDGDADHAGKRFGQLVLACFAELWRCGGGHPTGDDSVGALLTPYRETYGDGLPDQAVYTFLSAWTRLYGIVAMEVFGHLSWAMTDLRPMFERELTQLIAAATTPRLDTAAARTRLRTR